MGSHSDALTDSSILLVGSAPWIEEVAAALQTENNARVQVERWADLGQDRQPVADQDCVITDLAASGETDRDFGETIRQWTSRVPVVVCTANGSEEAASETLAAGAEDYIALSDSEPVPTGAVIDRVADVVASAREWDRARTRARQFDAQFHDSPTARWVLEPDGDLARVNQPALEMVQAGVDEVCGRPFWDLPWWDDTSQARVDLERLLEGVRREGKTDRVVTSVRGEEPERLVELTIVPITDDGSLTGILVEGDEITERVSVYRDLRRSEQLHRVTLNNMTDTVLVTDDAGRFTYVCPNVHFIFGYTAEEIRKLGTIQELLGADLFDRADLEASGVLKNIETTATDKAGREHTLLINVREVDIQDGTLLYSCRDITKRKQREEALATLQETARELLYAETSEEIAREVVEDVPAVLDLPASAVYRFDPDGNALEPVASSEAMARLHGPLPTVSVDDDGLVRDCFVEGESRFFDDVHGSERLTNAATGLRSAAYIPLGDHGVFVAGSPDVGLFNTVKRELADLLAATAEAALDRVRRERTLREQERELKRRNSDLTSLNRINEIIRDVDQALVGAETRAEIDDAVCERLTDDDRFAFAWIGVVDSVENRLEPRAWAGGGEDYLDAVTLDVDVESDGAGELGEPAARTAASGELTVVSRVARDLREADWRTEALSRDFRSVVSVPLAYDDVPYGVLTVYADTQDAFGETARAVLRELGETVASARSAIERKNALLTTSITRLEFDLGESSFVLSQLARAADCTVSYRGGVQQTPGGSHVFVTVEGAPVEAVQDAAEALLAIEAVRRISTDGTESVFRLHLAEGFLAMELADHGAVLRRARADPDSTTIEVDIPETVDESHVVRYVEETLSEVNLRSKRRIDRSASATLSAEFLEGLTDRQLEVVQTAHYAGFFESPRESTGEEVADTLGISPTAFYRHVRTVQRKLFTKLFDDVGVSATVASDA